MYAPALPSGSARAEPTHEERIDLLSQSLIMSTSVELTAGDWLGKHIRTAAYIILVLAAFFPFLDVLSGLLPLNLGNATWRFGAVGVFSTYVMGLSLELLLLAVLAALSNHRRVLLVLGVISLLLALALLGGTVLFLLDALQTRARVNPAMLKRFDFATGGATAKLVLYAIANLILARGEFLAARRLARLTVTRARGKTAPLVGVSATDAGRTV
jgi:hypothetical protein